jgi:hypothetical protein
MAHTPNSFPVPEKPEKKTNYARESLYCDKQKFKMQAIKWNLF